MSTTASKSTMDRREAFNSMALNCISYLESFEECKSVNFQSGDGASTQDAVQWEKKFAPYTLPKDLKSCYSLFNGFCLSWTVGVGDQTIPVGEIRMNRIDSIIRISLDGTFAPNIWNDQHIAPPDPRTSAAFLLDSQSETGDIVMVYRQRVTPCGSSSTTVEHGGGASTEYVCAEPEIWFVDLSARWHYLCSNFTHFLRLLVVHLGIYGWQLAFTPEGLSITTQHWMNIFCKERLMIDKTWRDRANHIQGSLQFR